MFFESYYQRQSSVLSYAQTAVLRYVQR